MKIFLSIVGAVIVAGIIGAIALLNDGDVIGYFIAAIGKITDWIVGIPFLRDILTK